jgi:hypothetical protein
MDSLMLVHDVTFVQARPVDWLATSRNVQSPASKCRKEQTAKT